MVEVGLKVQTLGPSRFHENSNFSKFFQTMFLSVRVLLLVRISAILDHIWESKGRKTFEKGYFMDAESVCKTLKTLTTLNDILIKLTKIMYLHESVNRKPRSARNSVFWRNVYKFLDYIKNRHICHALTCITLLVRFLY